MPRYYVNNGHYLVAWVADSDGLWRFEAITRRLTQADALVSEWMSQGYAAHLRIFDLLDEGREVT